MAPARKAPGSIVASWPDPNTREALVQRLLRGESAQALAQETGIPAPKLEAWKDAYQRLGKQGLVQ